MDAEIARLFVSVDARINGLERGLTKAETRSKQAASRMDASARSATKSWAKMGAVLGGGIIFKNAADQVIGFDKAMRNANSIAHMNETQFKAMSKSILGLAGKTAQAPVTLARGLYDLESSGFNANQSLLILKSTAKAATAGLTDTGTSTKAVAAVLNAYHRKASDAAQVSDDLFQTVNLGVLSFEDLAQNIGDVLPFATALGVNLKQVGAATATMTKAGVAAPETMTRIKGAMVALIKPSKEMEATLKALGVKTGEELIKKFGSFQGALEAVSRQVGGSKEAMAQLFPDIRGLGGALLLTGKNAKGAAKDMEGFKHTAGATDTVLKEQAKSLSYQWQKLKAQAAAVAIEYGTKLVPALTTALGAIKKAAPAIIAIGAAWVTFKTVALAQLAITKVAMLGLFGGPMKVRMAAQAGSAGKSVGTAFATKAGLAVGAGIAGWEIGTWLRKNVPEARAVGDAIGNALGHAVYDKGMSWVRKLALGMVSPLALGVGAVKGALGGGEKPRKVKNIVGGAIKNLPKQIKASPGKSFAPRNAAARKLRQNPLAVMGRASGEPGGHELGSLQSALAWLKSHYPGLVAFIEDAGSGNQHLHVQGDRGTLVNAFSALRGMGYSADQFKGYGPVGQHTPGSKHYTGNAFDVNADFRSISASGDAKSSRTTAAVKKATKKAVENSKRTAAVLKKARDEVKAQRDKEAQALKDWRDTIRDYRGRGGLDTFSNKTGGLTTKGGPKGFAVDTTLDNPWLQAAINNVDNLVNAGKLTPEQGNAMKIGILTKAQPHLTGNQALVAQGMINDLAPPTDTAPPGWSKGQADLALAGLTKDTGDDLTALNSLKGIAQGRLDEAIASGNNDDIVTWANEVRNLSDSIDSLTSSVDDQIALLQAQNALAQEGLDTANRALAISQNETNVIGRAMANLVSSRLGTKVGLGSQTPSLSVRY